MDNAIYLTTTIPYVNGRPHVGFALELIQADVVARYHRLTGRSVRLQTGTDENAFKNVQAARDEGLSTAALVERNAGAFSALVEALEIDCDSFVRTTEERHRLAVHALWARLRPGDIYQCPYKGLYCPGCEDFYLERDLVEGLCPDHATPLVEVEESNYFFRLSAYQQALEEVLDSGRLRIVPERRQREVLAFVRRGLQDISISRDARRVQHWGIPVPGDEAQVVYVWIDALINYLTGLGFGRDQAWSNTWNERTQKVHLIGKNVWKFHAVYWPALLLSADLPLPDEIVVHGFLTEDGEKISKSRGNGIDPFACIEQYGSDGLRYYLLRGVPALGDGDFSRARFEQLYRRDLAHGLGNLLRRLTALAARSAYERPRRLAGAAGAQGLCRSAAALSVRPGPGQPVGGDRPGQSVGPNGGALDPAQAGRARVLARAARRVARGAVSGRLLVAALPAPSRRPGVRRLEARFQCGSAGAFCRAGKNVQVEQ